MRRLRPVPFGIRLAGVLVAGVALLSAVPAAEPREDAVTREQQIADLQKQIDELNRKLEELRATGQNSVAAPAH